jgi:hypothetical protein
MFGSLKCDEARSALEREVPERFGVPATNYRFAR